MSQAASRFGPRLAQVLRNSPEDELIPSVEAVIRVFDTQQSKNRMKAG